MKLDQLERRMLRYHGMPARDVARVERIPVERVLRIWEDLRARGALPALASAELEPEQLSLGELDELMTSNRGCRAAEFTAEYGGNHEAHWPDRDRS